MKRWRESRAGTWVSLTSGVMLMTLSTLIAASDSSSLDGSIQSMFFLIGLFTTFLAVVRLTLVDKK